MMDFESPPLRPVRWVGSSRKDIREFPDEVQKLMGDELQYIQYGEKSAYAKAFKGVGSGIVEIAIRYDTDAYRTVLAVQLGTSIYVLHCFQKKSKSGIKTPKRDVNVIQQRYKLAVEDAKKETDK